MSDIRPPLAERLTQGLREAIEAARGERSDLVETRVDLEEADSAIRRAVRPRRAKGESPAAAEMHQAQDGPAAPEA